MNTLDRAFQCTLWFQFFEPSSAVSKCGPVVFVKRDWIDETATPYDCLSPKARTILTKGDVRQKNHTRYVLSSVTTSRSPAASGHLAISNAMNQMHGGNPPNAIKNEVFDKMAPHPVLSLSVSRRNRTGKRSKSLGLGMLFMKFLVFISFHQDAPAHCCSQATHVHVSWGQTTFGFLPLSSR